MIESALLFGSQGPALAYCGALGEEQPGCRSRWPKAVGRWHDAGSFDGGKAGPLLARPLGGLRVERGAVLSRRRRAARRRPPKHGPHGDLLPHRGALGSGAGPYTSRSMVSCMFLYAVTCLFLQLDLVVLPF